MEIPCRKGSRAFDIMTVLQTGVTLEEATNNIVEKRPEDKKSKITQQIKAIIKELQAGKWTGLTVEVVEGKYKLVDKK